MRLENNCIQVGLSPATGGFVSIVGTPMERECLNTSAEPILFRVMLPDGTRLCNHRDSERAEVSVQGTEAIIHYHYDEFDAEVRMALDGSGILTTLRIVNSGPLTVEEVQFPWVTGLRRVPDDAVVTPSFARRVIADPLGEGLGGDHRHAEEYLKKVVIRYPERMATAWCDYGNADGGLALEGRHTDFSILDFFIHKGVYKSADGVRRSLDLATVHPVRIRPGETWHSPPVRVFVHAGDWHVAADAHREWVETWVRKPDRPRKFAESIGWHFFLMKHQDGYATFTYADLPRMAKAAQSAGCPYLMLFGWHAPGHDNRYMYGYVPNEDWGGAAALREGLRLVREMGVEAIPFFNGTLSNVQAPEHRAVGHRWEALTREGAPYYAGDWAGFNFDEPATSRGRVHHEICTCDEHRPYFVDTARRIAQDYGFGHLQLDQISLKMAPCYSDEHHHARPDRAYVDGLATLLPEVRMGLREANPEGLMIGEGANEFVGQWCDGAWTWDFLSNPEPVLYAVPWLFTSTAIDALEYAEANKAFACKIGLDLRIGGGDECVDEYPAFAEHLRGLADLRRRTAPYYACADFRDQEGIRRLRGVGVLAKTYRNKGTGKASIVLAETSGKPATARLACDWIGPRSSVTLESSLATAPRLERRRGVLRLELRPYEVIIMCLDDIDA